MSTAIEGGEWSVARPGRTLPPGKAQYPLYRRLGGPQGRSGQAKNLAPPWFDPRSVQPVVSRYTDWATRPTHPVYKDTHIYIYIYKGWTCFWSTSVPNVTCLNSWLVVAKMSKYQVQFMCRHLLVLYITREYYRHRICTSFPGLLSCNVISERKGKGRRCRSCLKNRATSVLVLGIVGK